MIKVYTQLAQGQVWLQAQRFKKPIFACVLGFTSTSLIPGISAAGATPESRKYTAIADAEFLITGKNIKFPLPPLVAGASPVVISRAVVAALDLPCYVFDAGLLMPPTIEHINLGGKTANCLSTGQALPLDTVRHLWQQGLLWGEKLAELGEYVILSECVVGGTTTALAVLTALGFDAQSKINSSHVVCNHEQKYSLVEAGIHNWRVKFSNSIPDIDPFAVVAAVGDPMQIVVAGMAIAISRTHPVLLAGGTQMLAVYALARSIAKHYDLDWEPTQIAIGTTRWVAEDTTGDTVGLAAEIGDVPLLATQLSFADSHYEELRAYEKGFVKEGVGAGGAAIAAHLSQNWTQKDLLGAIERVWQDAKLS